MITLLRLFVLHLSDGIITKEEKAFINRTAINLEIEDNEVAQIMANPDQYPINPPANEQRRLERLYDFNTHGLCRSYCR